MDVAAVSQILTSVGSIATAGTIVSGFVLYQQGKRDAYVTKLRTTVTQLRSDVSRLDGLISYELANEIASSVVYSREMECPLQEIWEEWFEGQNPKSMEDFKTYLKRQFPPVTVAANSRLQKSHEELLAALELNGESLRFSYPGLFRIVSADKTLFRNIVAKARLLAHDNSVWEDQLLPGCFEKHDQIRSVDKLKAIILTNFVATMGTWFKKGQADINDLLEITQICANSYLSLSDKKILQASAQERSAKLDTLPERSTLIEDLDDAETALKRWMPQDTITKYNQHVTRLKQRMEMSEA